VAFCKTPCFSKFHKKKKYQTGAQKCNIIPDRYSDISFQKLLQIIAVIYTICMHFLLNFFKRTASMLVAFTALHLKLLTLYSQIKPSYPSQTAVLPYMKLTPTSSEPGVRDRPKVKQFNLAGFWPFVM
jgi:hypothetical protein